MSAVAAQPQPPPPPPPSAKVLGERKAIDSASSQTNKRPVSAGVQAAQKQERRVTRSSRGGPDDSKDANDGDETGVPADLYLPHKTPILLTTRKLTNLKDYPPPDALQRAPHPIALGQAGPSTVPPSGLSADEAPRTQKEPEKPLFRPLKEGELLPARGTRHKSVPEVDTSDAFYLRMHRYPEILERRASRLERERLIHERSKLINDIEELRGRTWVYAGTNAGGRAEEERQKKIKDMEEKLKRYDVLLPNQPRKSNFLNLGGAAPAPPPSSQAVSHARRSPSRTASPAPHAPAARVNGRNTRAHPVASTSTSTSVPSPADGPVAALPTAAPPHAAPPTATIRADTEIPRPSTPLSASATTSGNGTTIRILFGPPSTTSSPAPPAPDSSFKAQTLRASSSSARSDLGAELYTHTGELRRGPKRDRRAEKARAAERKRLGLAPRANIEKHLYGTKVQKKPARRASHGVSYAEDENEEEEDELTENDDELTELEDGEDGEGGEEGEGDGWDETDSETGEVRRKKPPVRKRLRDSFFESASLRDSVMGGIVYPTRSIWAPSSSSTIPPSPAAPIKPQPSRPRRSSSRVAYAFGQRLPDVSLLRKGDFELHGGIGADSEDECEGHSRTKLEDMVRERMAKQGEDVVVLDGTVLPKSALDAWALGPINGSPAKGPSTISSFASGEEMDSASRGVSPAFNGLPLFLQRQQHKIGNAFAPPPAGPGSSGVPSPAPSPAPPPMSLTMPGSSGMDLD
ncbi:hypothetical protein JCM11641_003357 [Rhodosporidiobolus odoratus]